MPDQDVRVPEEILDSLTNGVLVLDARLGLVWSNRSARRVLGLSSRTPAGLTAGDILSFDLLEQAARVAADGATRLGVSGLVRGADGAMVPVRANISPLLEEGGARSGRAVVSFARLQALEHRERRRLLDERLKAVGRLTEGVAHVIRNPLTGIAAGVDFLGRRLAGDEAQRENVAAVLREVDRLNRVLEDLVWVTHPPGILAAPADLQPVLKEVASEVSAAFPGVRVRSACQPGLGQPLLDAAQVRRALREVVTNAAQASPPGEEVTLAAALDAPDETLIHLGEVVLRIDVTDQGQGLPETVRRALFEPFRSTHPGARGLGLFIAHDVAARHGGELRLEDAPGGGTRATFYLPWETRNDDAD